MAACFYGGSEGSTRPTGRCEGGNVLHSGRVSAAESMCPRAGHPPRRIASDMGRYRSDEQPHQCNARGVLQEKRLEAFSTNTTSDRPFTV